MYWDRCQVHALAVTDDEGPPDDLSPEEFAEWDDIDPTAPSAVELHFDLDYIVGRVEHGQWRSVDFWVAPATLTFSSVWDVNGGFRSLCRRMDLDRPVMTREPGKHDSWHLRGSELELSFTAVGWGLVVRRPPVLGSRRLRMAERGGISFDRTPFG